MKLLREPLVHFLFLGALLFGVSALVGPSTVGDSDHRIAITPGRIANLNLSFRRAEGQAPTAQDTDLLIADYIREEVLCREARALGIDRDDTLVRTVLRQRMEYLAAGAGPKPVSRDLAAQAAQRKAALDAAYQKELVHYQVIVQRGSAAPSYSR